MGFFEAFVSLLSILNAAMPPYWRGGEHHGVHKTFGVTELMEMRDFLEVFLETILDLVCWYVIHEKTGY